MQPSRQEEERQEKTKDRHDDKRIQCRSEGKRRSKVTTRPIMEKTKAVITKVKAEVTPYRTNRLILNVNETK